MCQTHTLLVINLKELESGFQFMMYDDSSMQTNNEELQFPFFFLNGIASVVAHGDVAPCDGIQ